MQRTVFLLLGWAAVALLPQVAISQTGPGWDFVRSVPFTLMGRVRGHPETFDADLYAAANYTALLNGEARVEILDEIQARGLPWHHHVQASQSGANGGLGGLNQKLIDDTWAAYNAAPNSAAGWHIWDEPRGYHINQGYVREAFDWVRQTFPDQVDYTVTLGPFAQSEDYWGGPNMPPGYSFDDYQDDLVNMVEPDLLLYNTYIFAQSGGTSSPVWGPKKISDAAKAAGIPYWAYVQSFGRQAIARRVPSESDIRLHVFSHLAYGFSGILYFTYEPSQGPAQIDEQGNPEQLYYDVQKLNPEAFHLGERIKMLSHGESFWVRNTDSSQTPYGISGWQSFQGTANADPRIKQISPDYSKVGNQGSGKDGMLSVFRDKSNDTRYFMVTNMQNGPAMTAADAQLDYYVQFDWTVDHVYRIDRHTGQEVLVPLTNNRLELTLPGGTGDLFRHGTYVEPTVVNTLFTEDFETATDPGYTPGALLSNQNGWTVSSGDPILPVGTGNPGFGGQFLNGPSSSDGNTTYRNPAGTGGSLDPDMVTVLTWDWEFDSQSHNQRIGFFGSGFGAGELKHISWVALDDLGTAKLEFQSDNGQEVQYSVPVDYTLDEPVPFKLVVDGVENFIYGVANGAETDRIPITDQLIADIQGLQLVTNNEPNRRFPKTDNLLLIEGLPPTSTPEPGQVSWKADRSGDWNSATNWLGIGAPPNTSSESANFGGAITDTQTIFTNADITVNNIQFDNSSTHIVAGGGTVHLLAGSESGLPASGVSVEQGTHEFQATVQLNNDVTVDVAGGGTLIFSNALNLMGHTLTKTGEGDLEIRNQLITGGGTIDLLQGSISGTGTVTGNVAILGGTISPGSSAGLQQGTTVPEPSSVVLVLLALVAMAVRGRPV